MGKSRTTQDWLFVALDACINNLEEIDQNSEVSLIGDVEECMDGIEYYLTLEFAQAVRVKAAAEAAQGGG